MHDFLQIIAFFNSFWRKSTKNVSAYIKKHKKRASKLTVLCETFTYPLFFYTFREPPYYRQLCVLPLYYRLQSPFLTTFCVCGRFEHKWNTLFGIHGATGFGRYNLLLLTFSHRVDYLYLSRRTNSDLVDWNTLPAANDLPIPPLGRFHRLVIRLTNQYPQWRCARPFFRRIKLAPNYVRCGRDLLEGVPYLAPSFKSFRDFSFTYVGENTATPLDM